MNEPSFITVDGQRRCRRLLNLDRTEPAALLGFVTEFAYVVSTEQADAIQLLSNTHAMSTRLRDVDRFERQGREDNLETAIAGFAKSFFGTPVLRRQLQWQTLLDECQSSPHLASRLHALQPALQVGHVPQSHIPAFNRLVTMCCDAFVARGKEQARLRRQVVQLYCSEPYEWETVVRQLKNQDPDFVNSVAPWLKTLRWIHLAELNADEPLEVLSDERSAGSQSENKSSLLFSICCALVGVLMGIAGFHFDGKPTAPSQKPFPVRSGGFSSEEEVRVQRELQRILYGSISTDPDEPADALNPSVPTLAERSSQHDAAFEATRILMGLPQSLTPEQRKVVEQGFPIHQRPAQAHGANPMRKDQ